MAGKLKPLDVARQITPGKYTDGDGLYLIVASPTSRNWSYRYWIGGKERLARPGITEACLAEGSAPHDQHPDHQFQIARRPPHRRIVRCSKNQRLRDFLRRSIFDFCNKISPKADMEARPRDRVTGLQHIGSTSSLDSQARLWKKSANGLHNRWRSGHAIVRQRPEILKISFSPRHDHR
jgi:hypothetical protein